MLCNSILSPCAASQLREIALRASDAGWPTIRSPEIKPICPS